VSEINLSGQPGELRFTIEVTRKVTGKVETYEMIGRIDGDATSATDQPTEQPMNEDK
jgi:hypothetical protein